MTLKSFIYYISRVCSTSSEVFFNFFLMRTLSTCSANCCHVNGLIKLSYTTTYILKKHGFQPHLLVLMHK